MNAFKVYIVVRTKYEIGFNALQQSLDLKSINNI